MSQSSTAAPDYGSTSEIHQRSGTRRHSSPDYESGSPDQADRQANPHTELQTDTGANPLAVLHTAPAAGVTTLLPGQAAVTPTLLTLSESINSKLKSSKPPTKAMGWNIPSPTASSPIHSVRSTTRQAISGKHYTSDSDPEKSASKQISRHSRNKHDDQYRNSDRSSTHRISRHSPNNNEHSNLRQKHPTSRKKHQLSCSGDSSES